MSKENKPSKPILSHAYILSDDTIISAQDIAKKGVLTPMSKAADATEQVNAPNQFNTTGTFKRTKSYDEVPPPYDPEILAKFLEIDEIHFSCSKVKITDAIGRDFKIGALQDQYSNLLLDLDSVEEETLKEEKLLIWDFIMNCNERDGFIGTWTQGGLDFESVGWGAIEVVRSFDKKVRKINHIQASRIQVLEGGVGFVEKRNDGTTVYYQNFGRKVVSTTRKDFFGNAEDFDIIRDKSWDKSEWNLRDWETFQPTNSLEKSASELLFFPKFHPKSVYYGIPDYIPAVGYILANVNIRDYLLQYFDHNAVPQYAVIVKGADLDENVKNTIMSYFSREVKGNAHKTLVIPIPAVGEIDVIFEKLDNSFESGNSDATRIENQKSIMIAHGVNPAIIGIADSAELGSGKGKSQMENYRERIVVPYQRRFSKEMNDLFRKGLGTSHVGIKFDPLSIEERSVLLDEDTEAMRNGLLTPNEVRERNSLGSPIEGGDRYFLMTSSGPIFLDEFEEMTGIETTEDVEKVVDEEADPLPDEIEESNDVEGDDEPV